jgi:hypothetical protein
MPLQSSGEISIDDIRTEIGTADGSLRSLSNTAGKTTPDAMSEFYGYSHSSVSSGTLYYASDCGLDGFDACIFGTGGTYYWSGSGDPVINGYAIYTNSALTSIATAGCYASYIGDISGKYRLWVTTPSASWSGSASTCPAV